MAPPTLKQMLVKLLTHFETQYCEKTAMQVILDSCADARTRKTWRREVAQLLSDPEMRKATHAVFEPMYAHTNTASDYSALLALLSQLRMEAKEN
jgi:hypothetical protein